MRQNRFFGSVLREDQQAISVRSGNRVVLVPKAATPDEAMTLIRDHVGRNVVRVGVAQYPTGLGVMEAGKLKPDLVDACANIKMGTALFARVYRIVTKWYGNPVDEAFDGAIIAWQTGYFEGTAVFRTEYPGKVELDIPETEKPPEEPGAGQPDRGDTTAQNSAANPEVEGDPNKAGIRIDLSGIGARKP